MPHHKICGNHAVLAVLLTKLIRRAVNTPKVDPKERRELCFVSPKFGKVLESGREKITFLNAL